MKQLLPVVLSLALLLSACGYPSAQNKSPVSTPEPPESLSSSEPARESSGSIEVDKGLLTFDITFPAFVVEEIFGSDEIDLEAYKSENGISAAEQNPDGSITVTMTKKQHTELLGEIKSNAEESFSELIESDSTPYVKSIQHTDNFKTITVQVDRAGYEEALFDLTPFIVGISGSMYQVFVGDEPHVEVVVYDAATGDVIQTSIFPDDLSD